MAAHTIPDRVRQLIADLGFPSPNAFAADAGLPHQTVSNMLQGKVRPSADTLTTLATRYPHLNLSWLLTGEGEAFPFGVHGERRQTAPPDVQAALSEATVAKAEVQLAEAKLAAQNDVVKAQAAVIATLKDQLRKSGGDLGSAGDRNSTRPLGGNGLGFKFGYMLSGPARRNQGRQRVQVTR